MTPLNPTAAASVKEALDRLALEVTESAVLGCFELNPISSCYEDELARVRRKILEIRDGRQALFLSGAASRFAQLEKHYLASLH